ncbi:amino acid adenylation domain-containing protein [Streptomyces sp. NPDC097619]|uniref:non-ribosomal peptide synthetase n=1 Tax=Streptomyces sp. NPDC097619 TaxID=3157228 RepID=UPI00332C7685
MIPLTHAQHRLWFISRDAVTDDAPTEGTPGDGLYTIATGLPLSGPLDTEALRGAVADTTDRHEALRTLFPDDRGTPRQHVLPAGAPETGAAFTLTPCAAGAQRDRAREAATRPFDLARETPLRIELFTDGADRHHLLLALHHIAGDGASLDLLIRDLAAAYAARRTGTSPDWPELPVQFPDYALWQRELLGDPADPDSRQARALARRAAALTGLPAELALPADRPHPAAPTHRGGTVSAALDPAAHALLAGLARDRRTTPFTVVQAAFAALLTRLGAGTDIPLGCPVDAREEEELQHLIGLFVDTVVVRADTSGDPGFAALLDRVHGAVLDARADAGLPFDVLVGHLAPPRAPGRHPLFQVAVAAQREDGPPAAFAGLRTGAPEPVRTGTAKFDLTLEVTEHHAPDGTPVGIGLTLEHALDLFDEDTARRLLHRLVRLAAAAAAAPDRPLSALPVLTEDEEEALRGDWRGAPAASDEATVHELFAEAAAAHPHRPAVRCAGQETTYGQLDARAARWADRLAAAGVRPGENVAVLMDRSTELVAACLGILRAGAAYLPLDARAPRSRTAGLAASASVGVLVTDTPAATGEAATTGEAPATEAADFGIPVTLRPEDPTTTAATAPAPAPRPPVHPDSLACLMFTSGSTGTPKGVAVPHRAVVALARDGHWRGGAHRRVLFRSPHAFDASTYELWVPLLTGGLVVVAPPGDLDLDDLARFVEEERVTGTFLTATLFNELADRHPERLTGLHEAMTGGEAASPAAVRRVREHCPGTTVTNAYGPTETTTFAALHPLRPGTPGPAGQVPIGRPLDGTGLHVLDAALAPVPPGVTGELYVSGRGLAQGYLGRPGATAERFLPCPDGPPGTRMYRTGDLARRLPGGEVEYLGRADRQLKLRGMRVEPGEVEEALLRHPAVGQAAVTLVTGPTGPALAAYAVPVDGADCAPPDLRAHLRDLLPPWTVPATVTVLDRMPVTANGKTDHAALPDPSAPAPAGGPAEGPRTATERAVCAVLEEVLGTAPVGLHDNFFDLGGHSLLASRVLAGVRAALGTPVPARRFLLAPTAAGLAAAVEEAAAEGARDTAPPVVRRRRGAART